jgi:hypothetical protein
MDEPLNVAAVKYKLSPGWKVKAVIPEGELER